MYFGLPTVCPIWVSPVWAAARAMPKSISFTSPCQLSRTLLGLTSRWTTPRLPASCTYASASATFITMYSASKTGMRVPVVAQEAITWPRSRPSMNSCAMNCSPSHSPTSSVCGTPLWDRRDTSSPSRRNRSSTAASPRQSGKSLFTTQRLKSPGCPVSANATSPMPPMPSSSTST